MKEKREESILVFKNYRKFVFFIVFFSLSGILVIQSPSVVNVFGNILPNTTTPVITPSSPTSSQDLTCTFNVTDGDGTMNLFANVSWYNRTGGTLKSSLSYQVNVLNGVEDTHTLGSGNTTKGNNFICGVTPYDGVGYGTELNSSFVTIQNTLPNVSLIYPNNESVIDNSSVNLTFYLNDTDSGDTVDTIHVYAGNSTSLDQTNSLVEIIENANTNVNLSYNFTHFVYPIDDNTVTLLHFDCVYQYGTDPVDDVETCGAGSAFAYDFTGNGNNATCPYGAYACPSWTSNGILGGAFSFTNNPDFDRLIINDTGNFNFSRNTNMTVALWYNVSIGQDRDWLITKAGGSASTREWGMQANATHARAIIYPFNNATGYVASTDFTGSNGKWHFAAFTYEESVGLKLYLDGDLVDTNNTYLGNISSVGTNIVMPDTEDGTAGIQGSIDEVGIWNRSLSSQEILDLYRLKNGTYYWKVNTSQNSDTAESGIGNFIINVTSTEEDAGGDTGSSSSSGSSGGSSGGTSVSGGGTSSINSTEETENLEIHNINFFDSNDYFGIFVNVNDKIKLRLGENIYELIVTEKGNKIVLKYNDLNYIIDKDSFKEIDINNDGINDFMIRYNGESLDFLGLFLSPSTKEQNNVFDLFNLRESDYDYLFLVLGIVFIFVSSVVFFNLFKIAKTGYHSKYNKHRKGKR